MKERLTDEELVRVERDACSHEHSSVQQIVAHDVLRLVAEVRRLRALVMDAAPYFEGMEYEARSKEDEQDIRSIQARLKAELKA